MRQADRRAIEEIGFPGAVLMENAGAGLERVIRDRFPDRRRVAVLCGKGNNGGDGFVLARRLLSLLPETYLFGRRSDVKGDARLHMQVLERSGGAVTEIADEAAWQRCRERALGAELIVDALLGTGLKQRPSGLLGQVVTDLAATAGRAAIVAVDIPSGVSSDSGQLDWESVSATVTVTFATPKHGHVLPPACERIGSLVVVDIGIPRSVLEETGARLWLLEATDAAHAFAARAPGSHKGTYGHLLVIAGSPGKTGAAILAASAALRAGVGLVTVATPAPALQLVAAGRPEIMTEPLPVSPSGELDSSAIDRALALAGERDAVVLGPGLGQERATRELVRELVANCSVPLLVDADGLNALAGSQGVTRLADRSSPTLLTPHPGEMGRLIGSSPAEVQTRRLETARALAADSRAHVVLKGQRTLVADPEGRAAVNPTGNPGMATGGTGDVLAGLIGSLLAAGCDPWLAATAGVYLHGLAGDRAAVRLGYESLLAGDLLDELPAGIGSLRELPPPALEAPGSRRSLA